MSIDFLLLLLSAITIAILHTLSGPDHYIPFIALSKTRNWTMRKTFFWTIICGCGHVWSSALLGLGGAALGWSMTKITGLEEVRGGLAAWGLLMIGILYTLWGFYRTFKGQSHKHFENNEEGEIYVYQHNHKNVYQPIKKHKVTPWVIFIIFLLGPCEPMIPLLFVPGAQHSFFHVTFIILAYTLFTLLVMLLMVWMGLKGIAWLNSEKLSRYMHPLAGITVIICAMGMLIMGW